MQGAERDIYRPPLESAEQCGEIIARIQKAGPIMVIDPEKALKDLSNTAKRAAIASKLGMSVILIGGSTDSGEADVVVPEIRRALDSCGGNTLLLAFPGSSRQVVLGVHACMLLDLPQIYPVFEQNEKLKEHFLGERERIVHKCNVRRIPLVPVTYLLFSAGSPTSVEKVTGISGIKVRDDMDVGRVMETVGPWCKPGDQVFLELGSSPDQPINLAPIAREVFNATGVVPIISGGVSRAEHVRQITKELPYPVGFGSLAETTPPDQFSAVYQSLRASHPLCST